MNLDTRVSALAVILALVAAAAGIGLAATEAQAPELPAILSDGFALAFTQSAPAAEAGDVETAPAVCKAGAGSVDCTYY